MTKWRKKPPIGPQFNAQQVSESFEVQKRQQERRAIINGFWISMTITFILLGLKSQVETSDFGRLFEQMTYDFLQHRLSSSVGTEDLPIVLDISYIHFDLSKTSSDARPVTHREPIQKIVDAIATKEKAPQAIGVDVDFSPTVDGYADPYDPTLFAFFLKKHIDTTIPIFVGVHDSVALGPEKWLRDSKFIDLAACIAVPNPEEGQSTRRMPEWIELDYSPSLDYTIKRRCFSLGARLVIASIKPLRAWQKLFVQAAFDRQEGALAAKEFLVDYSRLQDLNSSTIELNDKSNLNELNVKGKIVLLGRVKNTSDTFIVPGNPEKPYAGVFLHACAAYTLLHSRPLYYLTWLGRCSLDVLFSTIVFGTVLVLELKRNKKSRGEIHEFRLHSLLTFAAVLVLLVSTIGFVHRHHLMWDDFILVIGVLLAHSPLERATVTSCKWLTKFFRRNLHWPSLRRLGRAKEKP